jgi:hypothetical protein
MLLLDIAWEVFERRRIHSFQTTGKVGGADDLKLWHRRYTHLGMEALRRLPDAVQGLSSQAKGVSLRGACDCEACIKGKHAGSHFHPVTKRATERLELVHADICGPFPESLGKGRYMLLFIDDATRYI